MSTIIILNTDHIIFYRSKGVAANLLKKNNKRRRTKAEIEEDKQDEILKKQRLAEDMVELE